MSNLQIERKLELIINLLETMPKRMIEEQESSKEFLKDFMIEQLQDEIEYLQQNENNISNNKLCNEN